MAEAPGHKFGQIIGDVLHLSVEPLLASFAQTHGLLFDKKGLRPARAGRKVSWTDMYGNSHDLDFVLERGGTPHTVGIPAAFIETAYRRYTKHSRNKAQEIQGAILPLATTHRNAAPFLGAILGGVFTDGALTQLRSVGFTVLYFPYNTIISAFKLVSIDASFDEDTPDSELSKRILAWEQIPEERRQQVAAGLRDLNRAEVGQFMDSLKNSVARRIASVRVIPLHGSSTDLPSLVDAITYITKYAPPQGQLPLMKFEIQILYNNGDKVAGEFASKEQAIRFLQTIQDAQ